MSLSLTGAGTVGTFGIVLSSNQDIQGATQGTLIGTLSVVGGTGTYTFSLTDATSQTQLHAGSTSLLEVGPFAPPVGSVSITINGSNGAGSTPSATFTINTVPQAPTLVDLEATSDSGASSTDNITNINTPTFDIVCTTTPVAGDVIDVAKGGTIVSSVTLTSGQISGTTALGLGLSALADGTYSFTARHTRSGLSSAYSPALSVTIDTVAPVLSSVSGVQDGTTQTSADLSVTTNKGQGTLFWIVTLNSSTPTANQIETGKDAAGAAAVGLGTISVSSTGAKTATATGLTTNTYYLFAVQTDTAGNTSNIGSASWSQTVTGFTANAVAFDGTNKLTNTALGTLTTNVGVISFWYKPTASDSTTRYIATGNHSAARWWIENQANNRIVLAMRDSGGVSRLSLQTNSFDFTIANGWRHVAFAFNTTGAIGQCYVDGVSNLYATKVIDATNPVDAGGTMYVAADASGISQAAADFCELYINFNATLDLSTNITRFRSVAGHPVSLGSTGSLPTGAPPQVYLGNTNNNTNWQNNNGSAGNFTASGNALTSTTAP